MSARPSVQFMPGEMANFGRRAADLSPVNQHVPDFLRGGTDGWEAQRAGRIFLHYDGTATPWGVPIYEGNGLPVEAQVREQILTEQLVGAGPASVSRWDAHSGAAGVDDDSFKALMASRGNGVESPVPYADFILGGFFERQAPGLAVGVKPIAERGSGGGGDGQEHAKPQNITAVTARLAMYWYLLLTYDYDATESEITGGIPVPPQNLGVGPSRYALYVRSLVRYLLTGEVVTA